MAEETKTGFFEEAPNQKSATRLVFIYGAIWAMLITSFIVYRNPAMSALDVATLFGGLMTPIGLLKYGQKTVENKPNEQK